MRFIPILFLLIILTSSRNRNCNLLTNYELIDSSIVPSKPIDVHVLEFGTDSNQVLINNSIILSESDGILLINGGCIGDIIIRSSDQFYVNYSSITDSVPYKKIFE